jgi:hypothetical protein
MPPTTGKRFCRRQRFRRMPTSRARDHPSARLLLAALLGAPLGASAIMISPITPWTTALVVIGIVLLVPSATVLVVRLLRSL